MVGTNLRYRVARNLVDWPQPVRIKILTDFNLADGQDRASHALNLPHVHVCLRLLRGVAYYIRSAAYRGIIVCMLQL